MKQKEINAARMEAFISAELGMLGREAWQKLCWNTWVGLLTFFGLCGVGKPRSIAFFLPNDRLDVSLDFLIFSFPLPLSTNLEIFWIA